MRLGLVVGVALLVVPACATQRPAQAVSPAEPMTLPSGFQSATPEQLSGGKISGAMPRLPDLVKILNKGVSRLEGQYQLCVATDGTVASVVTLKSIPGADNDIVRTLRTWLFKPQPTGVCGLSRFVFTSGG